MTLQMALAAIYPLIARLPELVELEKDRVKARSRRKPKPLRTKPVTIGERTDARGPLWRGAGRRALYRRQTVLTYRSGCRCRKWSAHVAAGDLHNAEWQQVKVSGQTTNPSMTSDLESDNLP
jgi:hypothetical protein